MTSPPHHLPQYLRFDASAMTTPDLGVSIIDTRYETPFQCICDLCVCVCVDGWVVVDVSFCFCCFPYDFTSFFLILCLCLCCWLFLGRVLAHLGIKLKPNTCFGMVSGSHTYFLAADTPEEVCV